MEVTATVKYLAETNVSSELEAVIEFEGITATLCANRRNYHEVSAFTKLGIDPETFQIVVLKCGYLAPSMKAIAKPHIVALSPGASIPILFASKTCGDRQHFRGSRPAYKPAPYTSARAKYLSR